MSIYLASSQEALCFLKPIPAPLSNPPFRFSYAKLNRRYGFNLSSSNFEGVAFSVALQVIISVFRNVSVSFHKRLVEWMNGMEAWNEMREREEALFLFSVLAANQF
jgi:hypothetical protein